MDVEARLLLYAVLFGSGVGLFSILRRGAFATLRFHAGVLAALATASLASVLAPTLAARAATPIVVAFCVLAVLPSVLVVAGRRCARGRRFDLAAGGVWTGATLLGLPVPLRREAQLYGALNASDRGRTEEALARMRRLVAVGGIPRQHGGATLAESLPLAGARRWRDTLAILDSDPSGATAVLAIEARAAAETRDLRRALRACAQLEGRRDAAMAGAAACRAVLAAAGRTETLTEAVQRRWPVMRGPRSAGLVALARAYEARGDLDRARSLYERVARRAPRVIRRDARDGIARLDAGEPRVVTLDEIETDEILRLEARCRRAAGAAAAVPVVRPWATWIATAVTALVSAAVTLHAGSDGFGLLASGALSAPLVAADGEWWRLFTAMLLHGGWWHLVLNLGCIVPVGVLVERRIGTARTVLVYIGSGLLGSLASVYLNATAIGVGASGAAMGLIGALMALLVRRPRLFATAERRRWLSLLAVGVVATAVIGLLEHRYVDNAAHGAGLVGGALIALLVLPAASGRVSALRRAAARLGAALLVALTLAAAVEATRTFVAWSEVVVVRARGVEVRLPGWLRVRHLPDGSALAERPPAEIALLVGASPAAAPRPSALVPAEGALGALLRAARLPATLGADELIVAVPAAALESGVGEEWASGVRFFVLRKGDAFVVVRLPADPVVEAAYGLLLDEVRETLRAVPAPEIDDDRSSRE